MLEPKVKSSALKSLEAKTPPTQTASQQIYFPGLHNLLSISFPSLKASGFLLWGDKHLPPA